MSIRDFYKELSKGLTAPAYLLYSQDLFLLKEAVSEVKALVPEDERDFGFHVYDLEAADQQATPEQVVDVMNTMSFLGGGGKTVICEGLQKLNTDGLKVFGAYLANPSPDSRLIMLYKVPEKGKLKQATIKNLDGAKMIDMTLRDRDMPAWVAQRAKALGFELAPDAMEYLIVTMGAEAGLLAAEVEKLTNVGKKILTREDVAEVIKGSGDYDVFNLTDAISERNREKAFTIYAVLSQTQEPYSLLGALNWYYSKANLKPAERRRIFTLLNQADFMVKSTGGLYPLEHLLVKLLRR